MKEVIKMNTLEFTFEHKYTKTIRRAYGLNVWDAYKNAGILTAEARSFWKPIDVQEYTIF